MFLEVQAGHESLVIYTRPVISRPRFESAAPKSRGNVKTKSWKTNMTGHLKLAVLYSWSASGNAGLHFPVSQRELV